LEDKAFSSPILCLGNFAWADIKFAGNPFRRFPGGIAFRIVLACSLFGVPTRYLTAIGREREWEEVLARLKRNGAVPGKLARVDKSVRFSWSYDSAGKHLSLKASNVKNMDIIPNLLSVSLIKKSSFVALGALGYKNEARIVSLVKEQRKLLFYIFHESNLLGTPPKEYLRMFKKVDFLFLNQKEAFLLTGVNDYFKAGAILSGLAKNLVLTRGSEGVSMFKEGRLQESLEAIKTKVQDTSGAGDSLAGGFMAGYFLTGNLKSALRFGLITASLSLNGYLTESLFKLLR
jgi:ribokinase